MKSKFKNCLLVLLAFTAVASGVLAWNQHRELARLRADALAEEGARADLQRRLLALEKRKNELDAEVAGLRSRRGPVAGEADGGPGPGDQPGWARPGSGGFSRRGLGNLSALLDNPEFSKLWSAQQKSALDSRYAALFKNLNLSPADLDKFKSMLVEKQSAVMDVLAAARAQGLNPGDPADRAQIATLLQSAQAQAESTIQQTLGDAQYAQYQNYEQTLPQRNVANQLAQSLSYTSSPLQDSQLQQLINILAANQPSGGQGNGGGALSGLFGGGFGNRPSPITDAAITQAQAVLSADQVAALQQLQAQQQAQRQIAQMMRQSGNSGGSAGFGWRGCRSVVSGGGHGFRALMCLARLPMPENTCAQVALRGSLPIPFKPSRL